MSNQTFVIITGGKNDDVDHVTIKAFPNYRHAAAYCEKTHEPNKKYWTQAEIICLNEQIELAHEPTEGY